MAEKESIQESDRSAASSQGAAQRTSPSAPKDPLNTTPPPEPATPTDSAPESALVQQSPPSDSENPNPFESRHNPRARLRELGDRLFGVPPADLMWHRVLTADDRQALGGDFAQAIDKDNYCVAMYRKRYTVSVERAIIKIAYGIGLLSEIEYRWLKSAIAEWEGTIPPSRSGDAVVVDPDDDPPRKVREAIINHRLVLVQAPGIHRVYWNGSPVKAPWGKHHMSWELLMELARQAIGGLGVDRFRLTEADGDRTIIYRRGHLKKLLPPELDGLIKYTERGTYKLQLRGKDICILELQTDQWELDDE